MVYVFKAIGEAPLEYQGLVSFNTSYFYNNIRIYNLLKLKKFIYGNPLYSITSRPSVTYTL